jgi:1-acyl-sn-glycerol-3-phosphate acyltransferase
VAEADEYATPAGRRRAWYATILPDTPVFYARVVLMVGRARMLVTLGRMDDASWNTTSQQFHHIVETMGARVEITGMQHIRELAHAAVFVGNHMSTLETFLLPGIVNPVRRCNFIIKPSLLRIPWIGPIFRKLGLIVVSRDNAREDLKISLDVGGQNLAEGRSVIVFPQSTRTVALEPRRFNTLGVKLARRSGVPIIPLALSTSAWKLGRVVRDFGSFDRHRPVRVAFGEPIDSSSDQHAIHQQVLDFIAGRLRAWHAEDAAAGIEWDDEPVRTTTEEDS